MGKTDAQLRSDDPVRPFKIATSVTSFYFDNVVVRYPCAEPSRRYGVLIGHHATGILFMRPDFERGHSWRPIAFGIALVVAASGGAIADCKVTGRRAVFVNVVVRPERMPSFTAGISSQPATVTIPTARTSAFELAVAAPIAFTGALRNPWLSIAKSSADDDRALLHHHPGDRLVRPISRGSSVRGALVLEAGDVLGGEQADPAETAYPLDVPCDALTLDEVSSDADVEEAPRAEAEPIRWVPRRPATRFVLREQPRKGAPAIVLRNDGCADCFELTELRRARGWVRVTRGDERCRVVGWAPLEQLRRTDENILRGLTCHGMHEHKVRGFSAARQFDGRVYDGPAEVVEGTQVYAVPERGRWGTMARTAHVGVHHAEDSEWVEITSMPDVSGIEGHAYVAFEHVRFPEHRAYEPSSR